MINTCTAMSFHELRTSVSSTYSYNVASLLSVLDTCNEQQEDPSLNTTTLVLPQQILDYAK